MQSKRKITMILSTFITVSVAAAVPTSLLTLNKGNLTSIENNNLKDWNTGGTTDETAASFAFKTADELKTQFESNPFTPKTPQDFTNEDIKLFLKITNGSASNWHVVKSEVTNEDSISGIVRFKVYQNLKKADGSYQETLIKNGQSDEWNTSTASYLSTYIVKNQYSFEWASDEEMKNFFETTTLTASQLTKEIVLNNLVSRNSVLPPDDQITVTISDVSSEAANYGVKKVSVSFSGSVTTTSSNSNQQITSEKTFRGFKSTNGLSNEMSLEFTSENIGDWTISDLNAFKNALEPNENKVQNLTASEFVSVIDNTNPTQQTALLNMLTKGTYLTNQPIVKIKYMGLDVTDSNFATITGLSADDYKITKVRTIPNDVDGSLELLYTFTSIDIYTGKNVDKEVKQTFPAGTFKTNADANKILKFAWLSQEALMPLGGSLDMVNSSKKNSDDPDFLRLLSNQFFSGTQDTYDKPRTVSIDFENGSTYNSQTGNYEPTVSNEESIIITLTFDSWNGAFYTDETGAVREGFKTSKIFKLDGYTVEGNIVNFKTQNDFIASNPTYVYTTPSSIVMDIKAAENPNDPTINTKQAAFFTLGENNTAKHEVSYVPNNREGTISITISFYEEINNTKSYKGSYFRIYSGMKKTPETSDILEFAWIPSTGMNSELLSIPIDEVTKTDVIDYYLINIPMFANKTLNENNVDIKVEGDTVLKVDVTIYNFDQANPNITVSEQKFFTKLTGFASTKYTSDANIVPPKDLTALISIPIAAIGTCILVFVLIAMVAQRARIRRFKEDKVKLEAKKLK